MSVNVSVVYIWKGNIAVHNFNCFLLLRIFSLVSRVAFKLDIFLLTTADNFAVLKFLNKKLIVPSLPAIAARIICSLWFSDIFFRYCILRFTTVIICKEKKKKACLDGLWASSGCHYYNNIPNKWQVEVVGFKVLHRVSIIKSLSV